jgi:hypothetical protein
MIASIGPFWDANETWLVLGVGILLIAFPQAHGLVLGELYLPVALMLVGLTLRGVAFDFRVEVKDAHKNTWDLLFFAGSTLAAVAQGWMLGRYVSGFGTGWNYPLFAAAIAAALPMAYVLLGATWLIMKTEGELQARAIQWARVAWTPMVGDSFDERRQSARGAKPSRHAPCPRPGVLASFHAADPRLRPRLFRPRVQPLSVRGARSVDGLAGREQPRGLEGDLARRVHLGPGDRRLHPLFVPRIPWQDG